MERWPGLRGPHAGRLRQPIRPAAVIALKPGENAWEIAAKPVMRGLLLAAALVLAGTTAPFAGISVDGLILDNGNEDLDMRHDIRQGPVLIDLNGSLDGVTGARSRHAYGRYDAAANVFTAHKPGIYLVEPQ